MERKGIISDIKRFAVHDGDGIRTTVFFKGCPLSCVWCHNPEGLDFRPQLAWYSDQCVQCGGCVRVCPVGAHRMVSGVHTFARELCTACGRCARQCPGKALILYGREMTVEELLPILLEDREFYEASGGGVTLSGGECLCQADFCRELLERLKEERIHTAVDTSGFVSRDSIRKVLDYTDIFLYDIKALEEDAHKRCTGKGNREILQNLKHLDALGKSMEIRIPYVPGWNAHQMEPIADFLRELKNPVRVRVLPYHHYAGSKYRALGMENTLPDTLPDSLEMEQIITHIRNRGVNVL